jgi:hypothetical protein
MIGAALLALDRQAAGPGLDTERIEEISLPQDVPSRLATA